MTTSIVDYEQQKRLINKMVILNIGNHWQIHDDKYIRHENIDGLEGEIKYEILTLPKAEQFICTVTINYCKKSFDIFGYNMYPSFFPESYSNKKIYFKIRYLGVDSDKEVFELNPSFSSNKIYFID